MVAVKSPRPLATSEQLAVVPKKVAFVKLNRESLETMETAFGKLSEDVTRAIKGLSQITGDLAKSESEISFVCAFVKRLKSKLSD